MGCINNSDPKPAFERPQGSHFSSVDPCLADPHPAGHTLVDPRFDHESCGVGFVATLTNQPSHDILEKALTALARLEHRGAVAADGKSSDGIGIHTAIPRDLLLAGTGIRLEAEEPLAAGIV